ncbi:MAG: excinuclease ABC subunit UvrC [Clostridiales bacterium]|nr:excinuclease ABC subunit UvrC [Clostridiales bacterium]
MTFDIKENLKKLPDKPGVYMHKDRLGNIIYVGKAISLKNRVRQYFQSSRNMPSKVKSMVQNIAEFEYITVGSEMEALILECNLIKKYRPKYNILLRDDKTYPYIKVTNEEYPRVIKTRIIKKDGGKYFGPYSDAGAVNKIVDIINSSFALKRCSASSFPKGFKPCLNFHINQCRGVCSGNVSRDEYEEAVEGATEFLRGKSKKMADKLEQRMYAASEAMDFESAASYRDYLEAAKALSEIQRVVIHQDKDVDMVIPVKGTEDVYMAVFFVRSGRLSGRETYEMEAFSPEEDKCELVSAFINQHYSRLPYIPREILLTHLPEDRELLESYLTELAGHSVKLIKPQRGEKKTLLDMASKDVLEMVKTIDDRAALARERRDSLSHDIDEILQEMGVYGRGHVDYRVEAYDISNTNGIDTVGAMVVFEGLKADKKSYRKFKIRTTIGQDDYGSMKEVLARRFNRAFMGDESFEVLPDIIMMDGGKGHVSAALEVIEATGFEIPVVGMVKDHKHRTRALIYRKLDSRDYEEISLRGKPMLFKYIGRIQEEVHRFAIEYHRKLRGKSVAGSVLDEIPGIGPVRRKALLEHFKSIEAVKEANFEELQKVQGMDGKAARSVADFFASRLPH